MKTVLTNWLLATAMLLNLSNCASIADCSLDKQPPSTGSEPALFVRVVDNPTTRNTAPIPPGTPLVLNEGNIYLVNADGIIVEHFVIVSANNTVTILTPENLAAGTIHRNLLDDGVVLPGVASNVAEVVIIGNTPNTTHTGDVNGEFIGGRLLNIISQHNAQNLNLFGRRALPATVNAEGNYVVEVHLAPTVARMELPSITGAGMIADFTVDGVFINNYHQNATISGSIPGINSAPNLREYTDVAAFAYNAPNTNYTTASNNALFYWNATANAGAGFFKDGLTVRPSNQQTNVFHPNIGGGMYAMRDHVWGFQVFARNYGETTIPETEAPRLVIRLSDIRLTDGRTITDPRFVTVGSLYRLESGVRVPVSHVRAADVYHIVNGIVFDETDLSDVPNVNEMAVEVIVTLAVWGGGDVVQGGTLRQPNPPAEMQISYGVGGVINLGAAYPAGGVTYQWQISTDDGATWTDIQGATTQNLTIPAAMLNALALFRRMAMSGDQMIVSTPVRVSQESVLQTPHPLAVSICYGEAHTFYLEAASGGSGTITYQWQSSADGTSWTDMNGATDLNLTVAALTTSTHFRRVATAAGFGTSVASDGALVTVAATLATPNPVAATINSGATHTFNVGVATGGIGAFSYQWQSSTDGTAWTNISGATDQNYTTAALTANTHFRRRATNTCGSVYSEGALVTVTTGAIISGLNIAWATRNVDQPGTFAANPHSAGRFFQWGTIGGTTHHWPATGAVTGWNTSNTRDAWTAANQPCPAGWRLPTQAELEALGNTGSTWHNNWNGTGQAGLVFPANATAAQVTDATPTAIFLPAAGVRNATDGALVDVGAWGGYYWSGTDDGFANTYSWWFDSGSSAVGATYRAWGMSVRCVQ